MPNGSGSAAEASHGDAKPVFDQGGHHDHGLRPPALRRSDVTAGGRLRVERSIRRVGGRWVVGAPKTDAGYRTETLPAAIAAVLAGHLERHVAASPDAPLFCTSSGGYLARSNGISTFRRVADAIGLPAVRRHELCHTGATLATATGATTKELMRRLGHSSPAAALLYQHAADDRDADIARALDAMLGAADAAPDDDPERSSNSRTDAAGSHVGTRTLSNIETDH